MAIVPINGISARQNYRSMINFGSRKDDSDKAVPHKSNSAMAVPVVMLMAMSPSLLNAKEPVTVVPADKVLNTELLAQVPSSKAPKSTYMSDASEYNQYIPGVGNWRCFKNQTIQMHHIAQGNGTKYHMLFTSGPGDEPNTVSTIYLVPDGSEGSNDVIAHPPEVTRLILHNIGKGKEFCSAKVIESLLDKNGKENGTMIREIKLDDDSANLIINLLAGDLKWKDMTMLGIQETYSAKLMEPILQDY